MINYVERPNWHEEVLRLTGGKGADCVVEIGGPGTLTNSIKALAVGGHISLIGSSLSRSGLMLDPLLLGGRGISLGSISVGSRADFEIVPIMGGVCRLAKSTTRQRQSGPGQRWKIFINPP